MLELKNIKYKNILHIDYIKIHKGKITTIVGSSGSGKTTLLRLLNKMISPDNGEIFFKATSYIDLDSINLRRNVVMLSQAPVIFKGNIRDNLQIGLKFSEKSFATDEKLNSILKMVELNKNLNDDAEKLSGGEKQRLALGRVILMNPEVFLLDEPSSALDEETESLIIKKLVQYVKENGKTLIMVTHSKAIAKNFSDHIIKLSSGKIIKGSE